MPRVFKKAKLRIFGLFGPRLIGRALRAGDWTSHFVIAPLRRRAKRLVRKVAKLPRYAKLAALAVGLLIITIAGLQYQHHRLYAVSAASWQMVGQSSIDTSKIKVSAKAITYDAADQKPTGHTRVTIAAPADASGKTGYEATINTAFKQGLSFGESSSQLSFTMTPMFGAGKGDYQNGQIMFPVSASTRIFQTFKKNGVKEDIVLSKAPAKTASWQWHLGLDDKLAAKLLPDGSVGIFAANPNLYGDIKISDAKSQALIDKARTTAKDYLIFAIPAPNIKNAKGQTLKEDVNYKLAGDTLTLEARNLDNQHYPISIDPSVVMTTTADFATGSDDGMIDYSTANQIGRSNVSLGTVGATVQQTNAFTTPRYQHTSVVYNGFLYVIGGYDNTTHDNDIQHCPINADGSVGACVQQTNAIIARYVHTSVVYNGYLYVIGGVNGVAYLNDIQHCPINADGSVGTCVQQLGAFTTARADHTSVAYNGYLYVIGGEDGITHKNDIQHCPINADGSVGTCVQQLAAFTTARDKHTSVAYNGYLYVIGGEDSSGTGLNDIQHCPINADGSVGTCVQQTNAFTTPRFFHTSVVYNGYLYVIGGYGGAILNDIQHIQITTGTPTGNGAVGATTQQTNKLWTARYGLSSVAYNGYLYEMFGTGSGTPYNDASHCPILADGSVGACTPQFNVLVGSTPLVGQTVVAYNGYIYVIGGQDNTFTRNNDIQYCPLLANGNIGSCVRQTSAFPTPRYWHASVAYNGYLYIIGGGPGSGLDDIIYCPINADGSVGTCVQQAAAFTGGRRNHASVAYNGYLYIIGGNTGTNQNDIQHCPINADGSVGTCVQQAAAFTGARWGHASVAYNGYLYIIGGTTGTNQNDIQYCPINSDGSVGTCVQQAAAFTGARWGHASVAYNGYLYVAGGTDGVGFQNDIQYLSIQSPAQSAHYERVVDIGSVAGKIDSVQYNGTVKCGAGIQYATAGTNGVFGALTTLTLDAVAGTTYPLVGQTPKRYIRVIITLNDQSCGGTSNITDLTVNYLLPPAAPALSTPASGAMGLSSTPLFQLKTTKNGVSGYAQYKILVYQSDCSTLVRTIDETNSQTGWSGQDASAATAYVIDTTLGASTLASHTYQAAALSYNTTYCWKAAAIDPGGSGTFSDFSATQLFTTNRSPLAPTLNQPAAAQAGVTTLPEFRLVSTDPDADYIRYKIQVCTTSNCSSVLRTIDQTSSQTGWLSQSQQAISAYSAGQMAIHNYQAAGLANNTQYWWRAYAIDPAGVNVFSAASAIGTFTTTIATQPSVNIGGSTTIYGGSTIHP